MIDGIVQTRPWSELTPRERKHWIRAIRSDAGINNILVYHQHDEHSSDRNVVDQHVLPDLYRLVYCLGDAISTGNHRGIYSIVKTIPPINFLLYVALTASSLLRSDTSWHAWSGLNDLIRNNSDETKLEEDLEQSWMRTCMRLAMCLPIGYITSNARISSPTADRAWNPSIEDMVDYENEFGQAIVDYSNRVISPKLLSNAVYVRLFGHAKNVGGLVNAEIDFFAERPNKENPFVRPIRRALQNALTFHADKNLPYWCVMAINHWFSLDETFVPLRTLAVTNTVPESQTHEIDEIPATSAEAGEGTLDVREATNPRLAAVLTWVRAGISTGEVLVNTKNALLMNVRGDLYLTHSKFFLDVSEKQASLFPVPEDLELAMSEEGLIVPDVERFPMMAVSDTGARKKIGQFRGVKLTPKGISLLIPENHHIEPNEVFSLSVVNTVA